MLKIINSLFIFILCLVSSPVFALETNIRLEPKTNEGWISVKKEMLPPSEPDYIMRAMSVDEAPSSEEISEDLKSLARGLQYDPRKIYLWVKNNIKFTPYFGLLKGANLTYLDKSGNDFDQINLMGKLLRESEIEYSFVYGQMSMPYEDMQNWLGVENKSEVIEILGAASIPGIDLGYMCIVSRLLIETTINGEPCLLDPSFKRTIKTEGINLKEAIGYDLSDIIASGDGDYTVRRVQNLNEENLNKKLVKYSTQLNNYIKENHFNDPISKIIGGVEIIPKTDHGIIPEFYFRENYSWEEIPEEYFHWVTIGNNRFPIHQISTKRISIVVETGEQSPNCPSGSTNFGEVSKGGGSTNTFTLTNPNDVTVTLKVKLLNNSSGAYSLISGGGTTNLGSQKTLKIGIKFSGNGQSPGIKTSQLKMEWFYDGESFHKDTLNLWGYVSETKISANLFLEEESVGEINTPKLNISIYHPYDAGYCDQTCTYTLKRGGKYV